MRSEGSLRCPEEPLPQTEGSSTNFEVFSLLSEEPLVLAKETVRRTESPSPMLDTSSKRGKEVASQAAGSLTKDAESSVWGEGRAVQFNAAGG